MKIILKEAVPHLGETGDLVEVKRGYAMNYLIPKGMASSATPSAIKQLNETLRQRAHKEAKLREDALLFANTLNGVNITIGAKASPSGRIYGSVNTIQIAEALADKGHQVDRKSISIEQDPVKEIGEYSAKIKLYRDVYATINFEVVSE